ncbi:MAG: hypothetical protein GTO02_15245 [Candidatus Dadabacteria bacterium]|nr:hypothetical protein [Candidatus Dadabacteria bacterium]
MVYRILSLDGGGIYGGATCVFLSRLIKKFPNFADKIDLIAGTSIGAMLGSMLAKNIDVEEIKQIFPGAAKEIFAKDFFRNIFASLGLCAFYTNDNLRKVLEKYCGDVKMKDLEKRFIVTAFDLDNESDPRHWKAKFYHNFEGEDSDGDKKVIDVLLASTAAPVFFPTYNNMIDGSVVENNPSMCAVAQTQDERANLNPRPKLGEIALLSIGREGCDCYVEGDSLDWGYFKWIRPILQIAMDRDSRIVHYQTKMLLNDNYHRISPLLKPEWENRIDAWEIVPDLMEFAEGYDLSDVEKWVEEKWVS